MEAEIPITFQASDLDPCDEVARTMSAARAAQFRWAATPLSKRVALLGKLRALIAKHGPALAAAAAAPRFRPVAEALSAEVIPLADACRFLQREAPRLLAPKILGRRGKPLWVSSARSEIHREPFGVVLLIGPGNYPLFLPGVQTIQALVAGNAVILKPAPGGGGAADWLRRLIVEAGFPTEVFSVLPDSVESARSALRAKPDKVVFTGCPGTGRRILSSLANGAIPATLELSGCDAVIVRHDADIELVIKALAFGLRLNGGNTCIAPKRVFVPPAIASELEGRLAAILRSHAGEGCDPAILELARELEPLFSETLARSAHLISGGEGRPPWVFGGVPHDSALLTSDIFGPVLSVVTVADEEEAVALTNASPFALGASVFSRDEAAAQRIAAKINAGVVTINDLILPTADPRLPFGGRGQSGFGVTRGAEGLVELTRPKVVTITRARFRPAFEKLRPRDRLIFESYLALAHAGTWRGRAAGGYRLMRSLLGFRKGDNHAKI